MSDIIIPISAYCWLVYDLDEAFGGNLIEICDSTGGRAIIDIEEIDGVIEGLRRFQKEYWENEQ